MMTREQLIEFNTKIGKDPGEWERRKRGAYERFILNDTYDLSLSITCHLALYAPRHDHTWVAYRGDEPTRIHGWGATRTAAILDLWNEEEQILA
jgi:hypothetical protein